jgi:hypothetical protein
MNLQEARISEINNLNLIYIYTIDSAFSDGSNKYIGVKVVYNKNNYFEMDYRNPHFEELLNHLKLKYQEEKIDHTITLLGDLSKKLVHEDYFEITKNKLKQNSITNLSTRNMYFTKYKDLIMELISSILIFYKKYELLEMLSLDGYNNKWVINYKIGSVKKILPIILYEDDENNIIIKVSYLDGIPVNIIGKILLNNVSLNSTWLSINDNVNGEIKYDISNNLITSIIREDKNVIEKKEKSPLITNNEKALISTYTNLLNLEQYNYIKIGTSSFISTLLEENQVNEDEVIYSLSRILLNINEDNVFFEKRTKNGLSKYHNEVLVTLDEEVTSYSLMSLNDADKNYIIVEENNKKFSSDNYTYYIIDNPTNLNLKKLNSDLNKSKIDESLNSINDIKRLIRKNSDK